jgi:hypothetical protein
MAALVTGLVAVALPATAQVYTRRNANGIVEATNVPDASDYRLTYPGKGTLIHSKGFTRAYSGEFDAVVQEASAVHNLSPDLVRSVIQVESEFDQFAVSSKGARGLMQLMPATARRFGVTNAFDPRQNIMAGCQFLRYLLDLFDGDLSLALAGYNAGENAVLRYKGIPPYRETRNYVDKIQGLYTGGWVQGPPIQRTTQPNAAQRASFFTPSGNAAVATRGHTRRAPLPPVKPDVFYKWIDPTGSLHVAQTPPGEGVVYSMIRAFD